MKNKINFLWHTALSMLDIGSSLIYNLLGRNLDSSDIELIEQIFTHMSHVKTITDNSIQTFIQLEQDNSKKIINLIEQLNKGKDILLITNKSNGYNVLQLSVINLLTFSLDIEHHLDQIPNEDLFHARLNIIKALLTYGCDPNRGICLQNKKRFQIDLTSNDKSIENDNLDSSLDDNDQSENQTVITTLQTIIQNTKKQNEFDESSAKSLTSLMANMSQGEVSAEKTLQNIPMDTPLLLVCCLYNCHNLINYHSDSSSSVNETDTNEIKNRNALIQNSSSSSLSTCLSIDQIKFNKRRHTIHLTKDSNKFKTSNNTKHFGSFSVKCKKTKSIDDKLDWPSLSIDRYSTTHSSVKSVEEEQEPLSSDSESCDYSTSSVSSASESKHSHDSSSSFSSSYNKDATKEDDNDDGVVISSNKTLNSARHYSSSEFSDCLEDDHDDYSKLTNIYHASTSNIYNYDFDHDDQNYYDKYEYDIESKCCKLFDTINDNQINGENCPNFDNDLINQKMSSLSTSIFSIPSSSIHTFNVNHHNTTHFNRPIESKKLTELAQVNLKQRFIYDQLNKQRLELLDMLLDYGADKYLVAKLSFSTLKRLNKKSSAMLKKWFGSLNSDDEIIEDTQDDLRALSPIMASICLDDVEVFSRLYKHHQNLFNYFKPDEDYELIYYAIRFQSKKCLIYLLSNSNSHETFGSVAVKNSLSLPASLNKATNSTLALNQKPFDKINKNINTMFYILENTRSSKIISVLLKCGFDLCKREPFTGNTALHCLFNANSINNRLEGLKSYGIESPHYFFKRNNENIIGNLTKRQQILKEFNTPHSLSKILFKLLRHGGLKTFVNTQNYENKVCMQVLFEWNELIDTVFFQENDSINSSEWRHEFEECVQLLLKSGADMFIFSNDDTEINCIQTLISSILKNSTPNSIVSANEIKEDRKECLEPKGPYSLIESPGASVSNKKDRADFKSPTSRSSQIFATAKDFLRKTTTNMTPVISPTPPVTPEVKRFDLSKFKRQSQLNKRFDVKFLHRLLNEVIDLPYILSNLNKHKYHYYHHDNQTDSNLSYTNYNPADSIISKYLEILLNVNLDEFETAFKVFKLLCKLEKQLVELSSKKNTLNYVSPHLVKGLISNWILNPNLFSSTRQFEKNHFVKSILIHLITNEMYDPNDCSTVYNSEHCLVSNNLLNHCVRLIFKSKTGYQLELIYDLMRTLIQYGANPNLEPYELVEKNFFNHFDTDGTYASSLDSNFHECSHHNHLNRPQSPKPIKTHCVLAQLCDCNVLTPVLSPFNLRRNDHHHHHHHHNHRHHRHYCQEHNKQNIASHLSVCSALPHISDLNQEHVASKHEHHHHNESSYFNDYFNNKFYSMAQSDKQVLASNYSELKRHELNIKNLKQSNLNPILLLTPSPSYESLISLSSSGSLPTIASTLSPSLVPHNIIIDKSILFLNHYKKFVKLLYDSMNKNTIKQCLKTKRNQYRHHSYVCSHQFSSRDFTMLQNLKNIEYLESLSSLTEETSSLKLFPIESLDMYLERLASSPRSLKSIVRRSVLNTLIEIHKSDKSKSENNKELSTIAQQIAQLPLPKRMKDYLLFIE